jgi:glycosyltransferase involved in cell wall biosynthesis
MEFSAQAIARKPRLAMFVFNPCTHDGRVRREAEVLAAEGYEVRVFARGDKTFRQGLIIETGYTIQRFEVTPISRRMMNLLRQRPRRSEVTEKTQAGSTGQRVTWVPRIRRAFRQRVIKPTVRSIVHGVPWLSRKLRLDRAAFLLEFWRDSATAAKEWQADVVHAHDLNVLPAAARVSKQRGIPLVYDSHELWRRRNRPKRLRPVGRVVEAVQERRFIKRADLVLTVSSSIASWLRSTYDLGNPVVVLRNVPDRHQSHEVTSLRQLAGLSDQRILLYTGRVTTGRGLEMAIDALPDLPDDLVLVMLGYGDPRYADSLITRAYELGVGERIKQVSAVPPEQVSVVASTADAALIAIQPLCLSYRYSSPNKMFEAVQAEVPIIASNLPDIAKVVREYRLGELFDPGDIDQFRLGLQRLLERPEEYRDGARMAAKVLCWEEESRILTEAYRGLNLSPSAVPDDL